MKKQEEHKCQEDLNGLCYYCYRDMTVGTTEKKKND